MYVVTYDISDPKRLRKVADTCQKYLYRVQKSVFEGDLTESQLYALKHDLKKIIDANTDSILFYFITKSSFRKKDEMGLSRISDPYIIF